MIKHNDYQTASIYSSTPIAVIDVRGLCIVALIRRSMRPGP